MGDTLCGSVEGVAGVYRISCNNAVGSVVKVTQEGQYLTLCEVEGLGAVSGNLKIFHATVCSVKVKSLILISDNVVDSMSLAQRSIIIL